MNVQVLVSTMNQQDYSLIEKMKISTDAIIVNQCDTDSKEKIQHNGKSIIWINSKTRGLSRSRNICLSYAEGDICLLADDDMYYVDGYEDIVLQAFNDNPNYSIIRFKINGIEKPFKNYVDYSQEIRLLESLKISSVEMAFRRESICGIRFDERIGAGTQFIMGEENAFIAECLRKKLKIKYVPKTISELHVGNSSWFKGMNDDYFISRGAAFAAMKTSITDFLILQFAVRKYQKYKRDISLFRAVKLMFSGKKRYLSETE